MTDVLTRREKLKQTCPEGKLHEDTERREREDGHPQVKENGHPSLWYFCYGSPCKLIHLLRGHPCLGPNVMENCSLSPVRM